MCIRDRLTTQAGQWLGNQVVAHTGCLLYTSGHIIKRYLGEYDVAEFHATVEKALAAG